MKRRRLRRNISNGISVISCTNRPLFIDKVFENYLRQLYPFKELIIILNNNRMKLDEWEERGKYLSNIRIVQIDENVSLGECYNFAIKLARHNYIAKFDDDDY
ncbi:MAG: glycosyltransferase family A protein, partial [Syntrophomonas sp.]